MCSSDLQWGLLFTRKGLLLCKQGASLYYGRRYFQKYVDETAKKEVKDIFGGVVDMNPGYPKEGQNHPRIQAGHLKADSPIRFGHPRPAGGCRLSCVVLARPHGPPLCPLGIPFIRCTREPLREDPWEETLDRFFGRWKLLSSPPTPSSSSSS